MGIDSLEGRRYDDTCVIGDIFPRIQLARAHFYSAFFSEGVLVPLEVLEYLKQGYATRHDIFGGIITLLAQRAEELNPKINNFKGGLHG